MSSNVGSSGLPDAGNSIIEGISVTICNLQNIPVRLKILLTVIINFVCFILRLQQRNIYFSSTVTQQ
jgi:hypothetical protein